MSFNITFSGQCKYKENLYLHLPNSIRNFKPKYVWRGLKLSPIRTVRPPNHPPSLKSRVSENWGTLSCKVLQKSFFQKDPEASNGTSPRNTEHKQWECKQGPVCNVCTLNISHWQDCMRPPWLESHTRGLSTSGTSSRNNGLPLRPHPLLQPLSASSLPQLSSSLSFPHFVILGNYLLFLL